MKTNPSVAKGFFLILLLAVGILFWRLIQPFILVLMMAAMTAVVIIPVQKRFVKYVPHERLVAGVIVALVFALVFLPIVFGLALVGTEAAGLVRMSLDNEAWRDWVVRLSAILPEWMPSPSLFLAELDFAGITKTIATWTVSHAQAFVSSTAGMAMDTLIFFITLYYFLADRERIVRTLLSLSPFDDATDMRLLTRLADTVRHVAFGALVISVVKGVLSGIGFAIFGVPGASLWAVAVAIASQVPIVGAGLILVPAIGYLVVVGHVGAAIGLTIWGLILVGLVDNILSPMLLEGRTNMHALLILLSILGGLQAFGWIGFIVGPTILAALISLLDLYRNGILQSANIGKEGSK